MAIYNTPNSTHASSRVFGPIVSPSVVDPRTDRTLLERKVVRK